MQVVFAKKGLHQVEALYAGAKEIHKATLTLRAVDYREEIVDQFSRLTGSEHTTRDKNRYFTAREALETLAGRQRAMCRGAINRMAELVDETSYSTHEITRREYERFHRDRLELIEAVGDSL